MCRMKSMVLTKDSVFCPDHDSHTIMLGELGVSDDTLSPTFVKIEMVPPSRNMRISPYEWRFSVDQDEVPDWYVQEVDEAKCRTALVNWYNKHVFFEGTHTVASGTYWAFGDARLLLSNTAYGYFFDDSTGEAWDSSSAEMFDNSHITAHIRSKIVLRDSALCEFRHSSTGTLFGKSKGIFLDNSYGELYTSSTCEAFDNSLVVILTNNEVELSDNAVSLKKTPWSVELTTKKNKSERGKI